jgi:Caspase domain
MKKKALIIRSYTDPTDQEFKSGVINDGDGYVRFLQSANGGGWMLNKDVYVLTNPSATKLQEWVAWLDDADIAQVYYSGHGFRDLNFDREFVNINPNEVFAVKDLMSSANRQITFVDACRTPYEWSHFDGGLSGIGGPDFSFENLAFAREVYAQLVMNSPIGHVVIYSCSVGESSYCNAEGGFFTQSFLKAAGQFITQKSNRFLSVYDGLLAGRVLLRQFESRQSPVVVYFGSMELLKLPLVIPTNLSMQQTVAIVHGPKPNNNQWVKPVLVTAGILLFLGWLGRD